MVSKQLCEVVDSPSAPKFGVGKQFSNRLLHPFLYLSHQVRMKWKSTKEFFCKFLFWIIKSPTSASRLARFLRQVNKAYHSDWGNKFQVTMETYSPQQTICLHLSITMSTNRQFKYTANRNWQNSIDSGKTKTNKIIIIIIRARKCIHYVKPSYFIAACPTGLKWAAHQ